MAEQTRPKQEAWTIVRYNPSEVWKSLTTKQKRVIIGFCLITPFVIGLFPWFIFL